MKRTIEELREALKNVLPEIPTVGEMPKSVCDAPGWFEINDPAERDRAEDRFRYGEGRKVYKAVDKDGVVWLVTNPMTWERRGDVVVRPRPKRAGPINDLRTGAVEARPRRKGGLF